MDEKKKKKQEDPEEGEFRPDEFEEIELPTEALPSEEEEREFEEIEMEEVAWGIKPPTQELLSAHEKLEQQLLSGVAEQALSAESGTELHGFENIVGVGISEKMVGDEYTDEPCVTVYVAAKVPKDAIAAEALVPKEIDGIRTDVVVTGELHAFPHRGRYRPATGGVSVMNYRVRAAGTLGCLVRRGRTLYILSNNHVLALVNRARIGDPILQPGGLDGGRFPRDVIARLSQFVPIRIGGPVNQLDCAIAQASPSLVTARSRCFGRISSSPVLARRNLFVKKCGRTTQFTRGRITDVNFTGWINYTGVGLALFQRQIVAVSLTTRPFSQPGDSGSLIVTNVGNRPVGLLFAGSNTHTIANPIGQVLTALNVSIVA